MELIYVQTRGQGSPELANRKKIDNFWPIYLVQPFVIVSVDVLGLVGYYRKSAIDSEYESLKALFKD